jgi:hypothetical protein
MNRRTLWSLGLAGPAALAAVLALRPAATDARPAGAPAPEAARLPVKRAVLFSSGVGQFVREGEVEGDARIDLSFPVNDINDLIKSLVLQDLGGGLVAAVAYDSHDPVEKTLKSFAVDLTSNPSYAQLLDQARGEKVEVVLQQSAGQAAGTLSGTVIGVEHQKQVVNEKAVAEVASLNLWCADGLRSVKLADVQRVRFLNPALEGEYRRALNALALSHDAQKKAVSLSFTGAGRRRVRVGYVTEAPIWKTSYRLALGASGEKPQLQGWAVVENTADEDWQGVRVALVSGRPISFKMDLYDPLYVPRPTVEPELFASLRPQTYEGDMHAARKPAAMPAPPAAPAPVMGTGVSPAQNLLRRGRPEEAKISVEFAGRAGGKLGVPRGNEGKDLADQLGERLALERGVASAASAEKLGESFQYVVEQPVNLPRQKSALLPVVQKDVEAARVSVYNPAVHAKYPLRGLRLKNATGMNLMQGPVTVYEGQVYAGDARIPDLQPNEERLLTYAVDLGVEVEAKSKVPPSRLTKVSLKKGLAYTTTKQREERTYHAVNRSQDGRTLLVEHPYRPAFHLASGPKATERTSDLYRFELQLPAGQSGDLQIAEERDVQQAVQLTNTDDQRVRFFLQQPTVSDAVKKALEQALALRDKQAAAQRDLAQVGRQLGQIEQDQQRLRANLKEMPPTAAAYKRYLEKFDSQETEIETLQAQRQRLQDKEHEQRTAYEGYLQNLNVE